MLLLLLRELVVREEEHVDVLGVLDLELVDKVLGLLHLVRLVKHWLFEHVDGLSEHCHVKGLV